MADARLIFHLSIPVADLQAASNFYVDVLGANIGRSQTDWIDMLLWGHQITLQLDPGAVTDVAGQGKRHFGVVLPWALWQEQADVMAQRAGPLVLQAPTIRGEGAKQQAKLYLRDPSNNVIEIKAYADFQAVLGTAEGAYASNAIT